MYSKVSLSQYYCFDWRIDCRANTHIFISGQVGSNQVCMEAWEAQDGPDWEETYHKLYGSERLGQGEQCQQINKK